MTLECFKDHIMYIVCNRYFSVYGLVVEGVSLLVFTREIRAYLEWSLPSADVINVAAGLQAYMFSPF